MLLTKIVNWLGMLLDNLFYPSYKNIMMVSPVFIIGMPRSGTTFMHNLLFLDRKRFTSMKLWEIHFAPSIIQKKFFLQVKKCDSKMNNFLSRGIQKVCDLFFSTHKGIHPLHLFNAEEDDYLFIHFNILSSIRFLLRFPEIKSFDYYSNFDESISTRQRKKAMSYYHKCIQKHNYVFGRNKIYLSKSPSHSSKIQSLKSLFPDCKIIYMVRQPYETILSTIAMLYMFCNTLGVHKNFILLKSNTLRIADSWYGYPIRKLPLWPVDTYSIIKIEDLIRQPDYSIQKLYERFNYEISGNYKNRLKAFIKDSGKFKSKHTYSLDKMDISKSEITDRYKYVYNNFYA